MKRNYSLKSILLSLIFSSVAMYGQISTWDVVNNNSSWEDTLESNNLNNNVKKSILIKGSGVQNGGTPANYSFGGSGFNKTNAEEAIEDNQYFETTIETEEGYSMSLTGIPTWYTRRSGSAGTYNIKVQYSLDKENYTDIGEISVISSSGSGSNTPLAFPQEVKNVLTNIKSVTLRFVPYTNVSRNFYIVMGNASNSNDRLVIDGDVVDDSILSVVDFNSSKNNLVKNTIIVDELVFGQKADIKIINMNGQVVKASKVVPGTIMNVSSLNKGMYIVTASVNGKTVSQKIMKK